MSISDKDYGDALRQKYKRMEAEITQQTKENSSLNTTGSHNTFIGSQGSITIQQPYGTFKTLTEDDLHNEAMKAPLSALVDMWLARWQGDWVSELIFQEDDFWRITLIRLTGANKLEKHNLATQSAPVYRIIE